MNDAYLCLHWPAKAGLILNNDAKVRLFFETKHLRRWKAGRMAVLDAGCVDA